MSDDAADLPAKRPPVPHLTTQEARELEDQKVRHDIFEFISIVLSPVSVSHTCVLMCAACPAHNNVSLCVFMHSFVEYLFCAGLFSFT